MHKNMHILVTGAGGMLGSRLLPKLTESLPNARIFSVFHSNPQTGQSMHERSAVGDLTESDFLKQCVDKAEPDIVINLAALTNVERCEENPEIARLTNASIPEMLSLHASDARLIQLSTDYVFNGASGDYQPDDHCEPICAYGESKRSAEEVALQSGKNLVVRTSGVFDWLTPRNLFAFFFRELSERRTVRALSDCVYSPTWADDLAGAVVAALENNLTGILHFAGPEAVTREQFAQSLAETFEFKPKLIQATPQSKFEWRAKRPANSSLDSQAGYTSTGVAAKPLQLAFSEILTEMTVKPELPSSIK